jgi:hypothetical protein
MESDVSIEGFKGYSSVTFVTIPIRRIYVTSQVLGREGSGEYYLLECVQSDCVAYYLSLNMEAVRSTETSLKLYLTRRRHVQP